MSNNDLGKKYLVEECQKLDISDIIKDYKNKLKKTILETQLELINENLLLTTSKTGNGGVRFWFMCPNCKRRTGVILKHPIQNKLGCRICLGLKYKSTRYKGMIEQII